MFRPILKITLISVACFWLADTFLYWLMPPEGGSTSLFDNLLLNIPEVSRRYSRLGVALLCLGIACAWGLVSRRKNSSRGVFEKTGKIALREPGLLEAFLDSSIDYIYFKDLDSKFLKVNRAWAKVWGASVGGDPDQIIGKSDFDFFDKDKALQKFNDEQEIIRTEKPFFGKEESDVIAGSGNRAWVATTKLPLRNRQGKIIGTFGISRDITAEKVSQEALEEYKNHLEELVAQRTAELEKDIAERKAVEKRLEHAERMQVIGQLAGGIAHDFNNQITGIMGCAEMLKIILKDEEALRYVSMMMGAAARSSDLTAKLLAFARRGAFQAVPLDIHKIIGEVVALLEHTVDKRIRLKQDLQANPSVVVGDPNQVQNALLNLALNARDAMPEGGDLIFTSRVVELDENYLNSKAHGIPAGRYLELDVTDTGIGMSEETKSHLFEPFFTTKKEGKGTGMGLAAVYGTVKAHKGAISVYSEVGRGSTFRVYLPLGQEAEAVRTVSRTLESFANKARVMVVDDEVLVKQIAGDMLKSLGYQVYTFESGRAAVDYYSDHWRDIDVVLLDMIMPDLNGRDAYAAMKAINPGVKVVLSSGYSMNRSVQEVIDAGAHGFLQKPFLMNDLAIKIAQAIKHH